VNRRKIQPSVGSIPCCLGMRQARTKSSSRENQESANGEEEVEQEADEGQEARSEKDFAKIGRTGRHGVNRGARRARDSALN
jgi:hypothetical protein